MPLKEVGKLSEGLEKTGDFVAKNGIGSGEELWDLISSVVGGLHVVGRQLQLLLGSDSQPRPF